MVKSVENSVKIADQIGKIYG
ncbi:MAG: hypothetical protein UX53_C0007G0018, partial [Candidatus Azambacteria bacterium GW2011_GWB2_46_37]